MPTTYTHYRFGKDVLENLPVPFKTALEKNRELFDIGLHGPDILFYYRPFGKDPVNMQGSLLHKQYADEFFRHAASVIEKAKDQPAARAYIYGFICHFALDSEAHKYIEKMIQVSGISHTVIERELDRFLMAADGLDPLTYAPVGHIKASMENAGVIAPFFDNIDAKTIEQALLSMRKYLKNFLPMNPVKNAIVTCILKSAGLYKSHYELFMTKEAEPGCADYVKLLQKVYTQAIPVATGLLLQYQKVLFNKEELDGRFHETFGPGQHWEEIEL